MARLIPLEQAERSFDIEYWQRQGSAAIFRAAWELVAQHGNSRGRFPTEVPLDRSVGRFRRMHLRPGTRQGRSSSP